MDDFLERLRRRVNPLLLDGSESLLPVDWLGDAGLHFKWLPRDVASNLSNGRNVFHTLGGLERSYTVVTGPLREELLRRDQYTAQVHFALSDAWRSEDIDKLPVTKLVVDTPFAGRYAPSIEPTRPVEETPQFHRDVTAGEPVEVKANEAYTLEDDGWSNRPRYTTGSKGIVYQGMSTSIPHDALAGAFSGDVLRNVCHGVKALQVFLSLADGCHSVDVDKVELEIEGGRPEVWFPAKKLDILSLGFDPFYKNRLKVDHGLQRLGMVGLQRWFQWCSDHRNWQIVETMLRTDHMTSPVLLEAVGRRSVLDGTDAERNVYMQEAVAEVLRITDLKDDVRPEFAENLNKANNKLVKHLGQLQRDDFDRAARFANSAFVFAPFLAWFGILVLSQTDNLPMSIREAWRDVVVDAYKNVPNVNL